MNWSDLKSVIGGAAPLLGTVIGGPAGAMVGGIVSAALGTENTPDAVRTALLGNPDAMVKIRQIESDNQVQLQQIALQATQSQLQATTAIAQTEATDRQGARQYAQATNDHTARNLAYMYTVALFLTIAAHLGIWVLKIPIDAMAMSFVSTLEGVLITMAVKTSEVFTGGSASADKLSSAWADFARAPGSVTGPAAGDTTTTTVSAPSSSPQTVSVSPAHDEQSNSSAASSQSTIYRGGS